MAQIERITLDPDVMGGKPCIRGLRVTVAMVLGLLAAGRSRDEILRRTRTSRQPTSTNAWPMLPGGWRTSTHLWRRHEHPDSYRYEPVT